MDSLFLSTSKRYDVLLKATANKLTWIRVTLDGNEVKAVLLYTDGAPGELPARTGRLGQTANCKPNS